MEISKKEIKNIAKLARIGLTEKEVEKMQKELFAILNYIKLLKEARGEEIEEKKEKMDVTELAREDVVSKDSLGIADRLIESAPQKEKRYFKVKSILKL